MILVPMPTSPNECFASFLATKGRKLTVELARMVDVVFSLPGTFDSEDVVAHLSNQAVSRASIYRTLNLMIQAELLRKVQFNGKTVYVVATPLSSESQNSSGT